MIVWDLDGTLVQTRMANLLAYRRLGVVPPEDFHTRPWQEWCDKQTHDAKGTIIGEYIRRLAEPTPLLAVWEQLGGTILTNSSRECLDAVTDRFTSLASADIVDGLSPIDKVNWLRTATEQKNIVGIYIDDSARTVEMVREHTAWRAALVQF